MRTVTGTLVAFAVLAGCSGERHSESPASTEKWSIVYAAPGDTLYIDERSVTKVSADTVRTWMRSTRAGSVTREETACNTLRTRSLSSVPDSTRSATAIEPGDWQEVAPGSRAALYVQRACALAHSGR